MRVREAPHGKRETALFLFCTMFLVCVVGLVLFALVLVPRYAESDAVLGRHPWWYGGAAVGAIVLAGAALLIRRPGLDLWRPIPFVLCILGSTVLGQALFRAQEHGGVVGPAFAFGVASSASLLGVVLFGRYFLIEVRRARTESKITTQTEAEEPADFWERG